jgi:hypothetical protein
MHPGAICLPSMFHDVITFLFPHEKARRQPDINAKLLHEMRAKSSNALRAIRPSGKAENRLDFPKKHRIRIHALSEAKNRSPSEQTSSLNHVQLHGRVIVWSTARHVYSLRSLRALRIPLMSEKTEIESTPKAEMSRHKQEQIHLKMPGGWDGCSDFTHLVHLAYGDLTA